MATTTDGLTNVELLDELRELLSELNARLVTYTACAVERGDAQDDGQLLASRARQLLYDAWGRVLSEQRDLERGWIRG